MKRIVILVNLILFGIVSNAQKGSLVIYVSEIKNNKGDIKVAIYNQNGKEGFLKTLDKAYDKKTGNINTGKAKVVFSDIPYGIYAVSLFHDENSDGVLNRATIGYPIESYGVSGNIQTVGPPKFEDCKFELKLSSQKINIQLQTWLQKKQP